MTILQELATLYDRLLQEGRVAPPGFSMEKISFALILNPDGRVNRLADLRSLSGKKPAPVAMPVPAAVTRTAGVKPNMLWDKTAYVLGLTAVNDGEVIIAGQAKRTAQEHAAFKAAHQDLLAGVDDPAATAFLAFLDRWKPDDFTALGLPIDALDQNLILRVALAEGEVNLHDRPQIIARLSQGGQGDDTGLCLVCGQMAPVARLHPSIKGVMGAQSSGAALVSFNSDAYESFLKSQGENAPVSARAAAAYGGALNALLAKQANPKLRRNVRVGDTTVVFWAKTGQASADVLFSEEALLGALQPPDDAAEEQALQAAIADVAAGRSTDDGLHPDTQVFILGLAPNAARLSVRFWYPGSFGDFAQNVQQFWRDLALDPPAWKGPPAVWSLLYQTAVQVNGKPKAETIPPLLGGQVMRAVLTGQPMPRSLLTAVITRIRADHDINSRRAAICKAVVNRQTGKEDLSMSLDPTNTHVAYLLGRLFAAYAYAEESYTKRNAGLRDKYMAGASANPARVFPLLMRGYEHNRAALAKSGDGMKTGSGVKADRAVQEILGHLGDTLPPILRLEDQARFFVGFHHQWSDFFTKKAKQNDDDAVIASED